MQNKQVVAIGIALQTQVLKTCPIHRQLYLDDEADPASAFALAIELIRKHKPYVQEFSNDEHELTDLISDTLGTAPVCCPDCQSQAVLSLPTQRSRFSEGALESR
jgi:hypothetical protein